MRDLSPSCCLMVILFLLAGFPSPCVPTAAARDRRVERDIDGDDQLPRSTRDTDADDKIYVWQTHRYNLPVEQKTGGDGHADAVLALEGAQPSLQKRDTNHDGRLDMTTWYRGGQPCNAQKATTADGEPDLWEEPDEGEALVGRSRDYNYDGTPDYTQKKPVAVR